ncbi:MAG: hypothetical protein U0R64_01470 [Candidatus Nanopelagicales bacterium]
MTSSPADPLLPERGVLLHIGPHKTGTTALQSSFAASRDPLLAAGVAITPSRIQRMGAAAATERTLGGMDEGTHPSRKVWRQLVRRVRRAQDLKVLVSSELFSDATDDQIPDIVEALGGDRVRVLITVRPLEKLLPSTWQQAVKNGAPPTYRNWVDRVLKGPQAPRLSKTARKFWSRHDHARLVERWAAVVGMDRVAVLIVDESNPQALLRDTESIIGVPTGTLVPGPSRNRSVTAEEAEAIRRAYEVLGGNQMDRQLAQRWMHRGAVINLIDTRTPRPDEPRIVTPPAQVWRARELGTQIRDQLVATGVRIIGDPDALVPTSTPAQVDFNEPDRVDDEVTAQLIAGLYRAAEADLARARSQPATELSSRAMLSEVRTRAFRRLRRSEEPEDDLSEE